MDIFAGSLPFKLSEEDLKKLFEQYGEVTSAKIIIDKITRQNKGFGFIEMPNEEDALKAIEALNGFEVLGRQIVVNKSEKKETRNDSSRSNERRFDHTKSNHNSANSGGSGNNFGANKTKGGSFNKGGGFNKGKGGGGFNRGNKRDDYNDDNNY
jgi:RNA recognition motif-containing protein